MVWYRSSIHPFSGAGLDIDDEIRFALEKMVLPGVCLLDRKFNFQIPVPNLGGRFFGLWSEFGENELTADASINWWFDAPMEFPLNIKSF